jgi:hypothetical protein
MTRFPLPAAFLAFALPIAAQTAPAPPTAATPAKPTGRIIGTVFCSDTRKPCRGAEVFLRGATTTPEAEETFSFETIAGIDGTYAFENLPPGKYHAVANLAGYLSSLIYIPPQPTSQDPATRAAETAALVQSLQVVVVSSQTSTHDITLLRGASLSGRVLYADGAPAIHAIIQVEHADPDRKTGQPDQDHHTIPTDRDTASTNDLGQFRIPGIRPGRYRIAVVPQLQEPQGAAPVALRFYSGDTLHRKAAKVYELRLGDDVGNIDITVPIGGLHRLSGRLTTPDNLPLNLGVLTLTSVDDEAILYRTALDNTGAFTFATVPPGSYNLTLISAFIGTPVKTTKDPHDDDTVLVPTRAFKAEPLALLVKDSDLTDISLPLTEIPLQPL